MLSVSRAQAGLEYLMTYGWALVLIVTVASVLFFVFSPGSGSIKCSSSDPTKFPLKAYSFPPNVSHDSGLGFDSWWTTSTTSPIQLRLLNSTAGKVTINKIESWSNNNWVTNATIGYLMPASWATVNGVNFSSLPTTPVQLNAGSDVLITNFTVYYRPSGNSVPPGKFRLTYIDQFNYTKTFTVTCNGFPTPLAGSY